MDIIRTQGDILIQDDGRWVVKGNDGKIHLIEPDGEVVTSFKNSDENTAQRIKDGIDLTMKNQMNLKKNFLIM